MGPILFRIRIPFLIRLLLIAVLSTQQVFAVTDPLKNQRDPRQFRFGFEPTRTNPRILLESGKAVAKKFITGKGDGVLAAELPIATKYRDKFMSDLRKTCPECKVFEARESHGEITFHIEFPDEYYIRSSLDAGALEWQTKPSTIPEIRKQVPVLQREIFDRAKTVGVGYSIEATGGHTTFSGFGNDTFWYGNYLKYRTKNTYLDWGFFGKDGYNATPVSLWAQDQQDRYVKVHQEHDAKWKKFMTEMEEAIARGASDQDLIRLYEARDLMKQDEYAAKLLEIYYNPKLENERLGKRSKPKYVANKPFTGGLIENRAIRPQKNAEELLKMAQFIEAEAWFVKDRINEGLEVRFKPGKYVEESKKDVSRATRKVIETLGLDWDEYKNFSPAGDVELKGTEKELADDFTQKGYGAKKRDQLFRQLRDRFLSKDKLTAKESVFLADLLNEMSYTVPDSVENAKHFKNRFAGKTLLNLTPDEANRMVASALAFGEKFPAAAEEILDPVQEHLKTYVVRSLNDDELNLARKAVPSMTKSARADVLDMVETLHETKPAHAKFGLYADLVLDAGDAAGHETKYLQNITDKFGKKVPTGLPARFDEVAEMALKKGKKWQVRDATNAVVDWVLDPRNARMKITDQDAGLLRWLAEQKPSRAREILAPLRSHYWEQLNANRFGVKNFYKAQTDFDRLYEITPAAERKAFLENTLTKVQEAHRIAKNPDTASFVERVEGHLESETTSIAGTGCGGNFFSKLKRMFRK